MHWILFATSKFWSASVHFHIVLPSHRMYQIASLWQAQNTLKPTQTQQANSNHTPMYTPQGCPQLGSSCIDNVALQQHIHYDRSTLAAVPASVSTPTAPQRAWPLQSAMPNPLDPFWNRALETTPLLQYADYILFHVTSYWCHWDFFEWSWAHHSTRGQPTPCACFRLYSVPIL